MNSQTYVECLLKDFHILFPNATLKKRCVALEIALFRKENKLLHRQPNYICHNQLRLKRLTQLLMCKDLPITSVTSLYITRVYF